MRRAEYLNIEKSNRIVYAQQLATRDHPPFNCSLKRDGLRNDCFPGLMSPAALVTTDR